MPCCSCCVKISLNLLTNLLQRLVDDIMMELIYCQRRRWPVVPVASSSSCSSLPVAVTTSTAAVDEHEDQYQCQQLESGKDHEQQQQQPVDAAARYRQQIQTLPQQQHQQQREDEDATTTTDEKGTDPPPAAAPKEVSAALYNVIYDTVELEPYYYNVDRAQSEEMLRGRSDGSCLVRPFKFKHQHPHIRYILSVHASGGAYFHLFIRRTGPNGMYYALGLDKPRERHFKFPADIVQHYRRHLLQCSSVARTGTTVVLHLIPLVESETSESSKIKECEMNKE